jgi:hypothetical protein
MMAEIYRRATILGKDKSNVEERPCKAMCPFKKNDVIKE